MTGAFGVQSALDRSLPQRGIFTPEHICRPPGTDGPVPKICKPAFRVFAADAENTRHEREHASGARPMDVRPKVVRPSVIATFMAKQEDFEKPDFTVCGWVSDWLNTQKLAAKGSFGAFLGILNPECNSAGERKYPVLLGRGIFTGIMLNLPVRADITLPATLEKIGEFNVCVCVCVCYRKQPGMSRGAFCNFSFFQWLFS